MSVQVDLRDARVVDGAIERPELGADREVVRWLVVLVHREIPDDHVYAGEALDEWAVADRCRRDDPWQKDDGVSHWPDANPNRREPLVSDDWPRPVVHWEIEALDAERQRAFYGRLFNWDIGDGPIMQIPAGLGGPEPGPGGHLRQGNATGVRLYVQVRDIRVSLTMTGELG